VGAKSPTSYSRNDTSGAGNESLASWASQLSGFAEAVENDGPEMALGILLSAVQESADAGQDPGNGGAWKPRKKDGGRALENASSAIVGTVSGNTLVLRISDHYAIHQYGTTKIPARHIIPSGGLPDLIGNAIRDGFIQMADGFLTREGSHSKKNKSGKWYSGGSGWTK
jgi:phage gpG-like protein